MKNIRNHNKSVLTLKHSLTIFKLKKQTKSKKFHKLLVYFFSILKKKIHKARVPGFDRVGQVNPYFLKNSK